MRNACSGCDKHGSRDFAIVDHVIVRKRNYLVVCRQEHSIEKCYAEQLLIVFPRHQTSLELAARFLPCITIDSLVEACAIFRECVLSHHSDADVVLGSPFAPVPRRRITRAADSPVHRLRADGRGSTRNRQV